MRARPSVAAIAGWALVVGCAGASAACLDEPEDAALSGMVAESTTTEVRTAWIPASEPRLTLGDAVMVAEDRSFDPLALVATADDRTPAFACGEGVVEQQLAGLRAMCTRPPPDNPGDVRLGLARILGFASPPTQPPVLQRPYRPSTSVSDDFGVVWASGPVERGTQPWFAFQRELPEGASLVRLVRCPAATDPCAMCWPFAEPPRCIEPVSPGELVVLRGWLESDGEPTP